MMCGNGGGAGGDETATFDDEKDRVREFEGVVVPDRELDGDIDIGEKVEGDVTISLLTLLLGMGI
jgi:hypothetical protein